MDDPKNIEEAVDWIEKTYGRLDVLINNAGILLDWGTGKTNKANLEKTFTTNVVGPYLLLEKASTLMKKGQFGRVVNVSSLAGQMANMDLFYPAYRISKAALNAVTCIFASDLKSHNVIVNAICPGRCKTDMGGGGPNASLPVEKGVASIMFGVDLPDGCPTGRFFEHGEEIPW
jgi:NAD(P)-dependent dehydrogenase (short-subunit alcohol dehydrogenase family)